jgi:hypothetical protein
VKELASLRSALAPDELDIGVTYLSGDIPQGRIGIGYAALNAAAANSAAMSETLTLGDMESVRKIYDSQQVGAVASAPVLRNQST